MRVIVLKAYGPFSVGEIIPEMPGNQARTLIARNIVREDVVEAAMVSPVDRMVRTSDMLRRGKFKGREVAR